MTNQRNIFKISPLMAIVILGIILLVFYLLVKGLFTIASWLMPFLLIATLIINYKVVLDYITFLGQLLKNNPIMGVLGILMTFMLSPFVVAFLFAKALLYRKADQYFRKAEEAKTQRDGEYVDFEEIVEKEIPSRRIELPPLREKEPQKKSNSNDYDELFK